MSDLNDRIALAKGWTWHGRWLHYIDEETGTEWPTEFRNPQGEPASVPDYTGMLEGVSGMLRELGPEWAWGRWYGGPSNKPNGWVCFEKIHQLLGKSRKPRMFFSPDHRPAHCVGDAWMRVFGKETD